MKAVHRYSTLFLRLTHLVNTMLLLSACGVESEFENEAENGVESRTTIIDPSRASNPNHRGDGSNPKMITWSAVNISTPDSGWATHDIPGTPIEGATFVGCRDCNPYTGDTEDTANLRLLCFVPSNLSEPESYAATQQARWNQRESYPAIDDWRYYYGWSGGYVGLTRPIYTLQEEQIITNIPLESSRQGDLACQAELDDKDAKLMSFHDSGGAWNLAGMIHPNSIAPELLSVRAGEERFIVYIADQNSNPWN